MASSVKVEPEDSKCCFIQHWEKALRSEYQAILGEMQDTPTGPQAKYINWNHYFASLFPGTPAGHQALQG